MRTPRTPRSTGPVRGPFPSIKRRLDYARSPPRSKNFKYFNSNLASNVAVTTPGFPVGGQTAKTYFNPGEKDNQNPYEVFSDSVDNIAKGANKDQRERDIVHLKGWKTRVQVHSTYLVPVTFRYAYVSPRQTFGTTPIAQGNGFLRSFNSSRSVNLGLLNSGIVNATNPINEDQYMILFQRNIEIGPTPSAAGYTGGVQKNWSYFSKWITLDKQLRYPNTAGSPVSETPVYLVFWWDSKIRAAGESMSTISATGTLDVRWDNIAYFHDRP